MSDYLVYNDNFHKDSSLLIGADNRGLRYGDGLFETIKFANSSIQLADWHFERLFKGLQQLKFDLPVHFTPAHLSDLVTTLCKKNQHQAARVRITVFRGKGGLYDAENHFPNCIIQTWKLEDAAFALNENGLVTGIYRGIQKTMDAFSNLKSNNFLPYTMAALCAKNQQWNDAFLLNTAGNICDATIANIFIIKNDTVYTCPLQQGCIAGIMRQFLVTHLAANGFSFQEKIISEDDLLTADELFLTNAIKGIRWVRHCGDVVYDNRVTKNIFNKLLKK